MHPLVFQKEDGFLFAGNPGRVSLDPILSKLPKTYVSLFMKLARPFIITKKVERDYVLWIIEVKQVPL